MIDIEAIELFGWIKETAKLMIIRLTLKKKIKDLERFKFRESLDTKEDDLGACEALQRRI